MVDFVTALTAIGQALNVVKGLNQIDREFDKADLKLRVAELSTALATAQITLAEAQKEAVDKDTEIAKLKAAFREKQELVELHGFHYRKRSDGSPQGRPHCPRCLQEGRLFMMTRNMGQGRPFECPECESEYQGLSSFKFEGEG
jgi:hypothetical protein